MSRSVPVAFLQLKKNPRRLLIAVAGLVMSSFGIFCQMGFEDSLFRSATKLFEELEADLVLISPQYQFMVLPASFSERRLYQASSVPGVRSIAAVRLGVAPFKNPVTRTNRTVYVVGVDRQARVFTRTDWDQKVRALAQPDAVLFDARSRPEFGPIGALRRAGVVTTEIANQRVRIADLFEMGASFSADGTVITTDEGFLRMFPQRRSGLIDIGLIQLDRTADVAQALKQMRALLPADVLVMRHSELNDREQRYWRSTTPAGFIFKTILIVSLLIGCVSAYQILYSDITSNLQQYATLKAMGYPDGYFQRLTFEKAWLLSSIAFPVGFLLAEAVYISATWLTLVPLVMTSTRVIGVYLIVLTASAAAGLLAIRRVRHLESDGAVLTVMPIVAIRDLGHVYGAEPDRRVVLRSLALDVAPGEVVVLTGASGAGKTTLLTLCGALRSVQHGQLRVMGQSLPTLGREQQRQLRCAIGFIFQSHNLLDALTAGQNVVMSLLGRVAPAEAGVRAEAALAALGLAARVDALPEALSGGEKQRVAVARALVRQPRLILADEPTSSLDDVSASVVIDAIRTVATRSSCAVLVATHDPRVFAIADRVLHLANGALVDRTVNDTLRAGRLRAPAAFACAG